MKSLKVQDQGQVWSNQQWLFYLWIFPLSSLQRHIVVDTFFGYDEESMDSETSSVASFRMDRTPATPDEDLDEVSIIVLTFAFTSIF